jgi:hypothetical protein
MLAQQIHLHVPHDFLHNCSRYDSSVAHFWVRWLQ